MEMSLETHRRSDREDPFASVDYEPGPSCLRATIVENPASSEPSSASRTLKNLPSRISSRLQRVNGLPGCV